MNNKKLITRLIQQDLKHHRLLLGLEKLKRYYQLDICRIVADLMGIEGSIPEDWLETYEELMEMALEYEVLMGWRDWLVLGMRGWLG